MTIAALGLTQIIGWGTTFYLPAVIAQSVAADGLISKTHYLMAFSGCLLFAGLMARRLGRLIDRIGAARVLAAGSVTSALGLGLQAVASDPWPFLLSWTIIGLTLRAVLYDGAFAALTALSASQARRSISLLTLMGGLASTVFWPIGAWLVEWSDWRTTLLIYAALNLLVCAPLHWWCAGQVPSTPAASAPSASSQGGTPPPGGKSNGSEGGTPPPGGKSDGSEGATPPSGGNLGRPAYALAPSSESCGSSSTTTGSGFNDRASRERAILLFSAALALHGFISYGLSTHLPMLMEGLGLTATAAILVASLMGPAQVLARIIELRFQRRISSLTLTVPIFVLMPVAFLGFALMPVIPAGKAVLAGSIVVMVWGASNGLMTIIRGTLPITLFGTADYGEVLGRLAKPTLVLGAVAPVLFGLAIEWLSPTGASLLLMMLSVLATALAVKLVRLARAQREHSMDRR